MAQLKKSKGEITREKLTFVAAALFHEKGYHAVGLNEICAVGDLPKGSLYYHFPKGKEQIAIAVIDAAKHQVAADLRAATSSATSLEEFIDLLLARFAQNLEQSEFNKGCPITTINLEMAGTSDAIRAACADAFENWIGLCTGVFRDAGIADKKAHELAELIYASVEGAMILARAQRDVSPILRAAPYLKTLVA